MLEPAAPALHAVRRLFESGESADIRSYLSEDVELLPPTYDKLWRGPDLVARLLGFAAEAFGGLSYTDMWHGEAGHVMRFEGRIGDEPISGVDIVSLDEQGLIRRFEVFSRPPKAALALREAMGAKVRMDAEASAWMGLSPG